MNKIYHFNELEDFFGSDEWKITIDITDIWNKFNNSEITLEQFNIDYKNRLINYKNDIANLGNDVWNDLVPLINKMNENNQDEIYNIYDSIYDWADKNDVLIKTK